MITEGEKGIRDLTEATVSVQKEDRVVGKKLGIITEHGMRNTTSIKSATTKTINKK